MVRNADAGRDVAAAVLHQTSPATWSITTACPSTTAPCFSNPHKPLRLTTAAPWSAVSSFEAWATPALRSRSIHARRLAGPVSRNPKQLLTLPTNLDGGYAQRLPSVTSRINMRMFMRFAHFRLTLLLCTHPRLCSAVQCSAVQCGCSMLPSSATRTAAAVFLGSPNAGFQG